MKGRWRDERKLGWCMKAKAVLHSKRANQNRGEANEAHDETDHGMSVIAGSFSNGGAANRNAWWK